MPLTRPAPDPTTRYTGRGVKSNPGRFNAMEDQRIAMNVADSLAGNQRQWLDELVRRVETEDLSKIAIFCRQGMHRSMSAAELLKRRIYRGATVKHLSAYRHTLR